MDYNFTQIESHWQQQWNRDKAYQVSNDSVRPKYYVLDMFPYPSGKGLHVGHPLGYISSDIFARYKRLKGFNVLHPMGYDAFGLPAEQYAIEHGIHPAVSTADNISNFRTQMDNIGFSFDWSREVRTSDPHYYKWTQWIFLQLFDSWFNRYTGSAERISKLISAFEREGNAAHVCPGDKTIRFTSGDWKSFSEKEQQDILMNYRLSYCGYGEVNWCEALGTVLANDEVNNGVSERGSFPVEKKKLRQWYLRVTEYADRLIEGLEKVDFSESMKEMQSNWIGKSYGAEMDFAIRSEKGTIKKMRVYTTRPETIFGVDFMVVAPELDWVDEIKSAEQAEAVDQYLDYVKSRSERERMAEKKITGCFTGAFAINPFNGREIPIWISEYVLAGYGTGAIMAVPCGDERDFRFAQHFNIPVSNIIGEHFTGTEANATKDAKLSNSDFLDRMVMRDAIPFTIEKLESLGIGKKQVNYRMRDAAFSRQRYWGEPFPIIWKNGIAVPVPESELPVTLPHMDELTPGPDAEGPLSNLSSWKNVDGGVREVNTMPGYAGSSWYFLRYMDPHNDEEFCNRKVSDYWNQVDLYVGGTEHAVGHLLYSRVWTKALFDLGYIGFDEPYKKLLNQGMIQGSSRFVYRISNVSGSENHGVTPDKTNFSFPLFLSWGYVGEFEKMTQEEQVSFIRKQAPQWKALEFVETMTELSKTRLHVDVSFVDGNVLDLEAFRKWRPEFAAAEFILEDGKYTCGAEVEKMSKSKFNTVNPNVLVSKYGADTFRMYEMFLGPVEMSKPWDTKGIEGVHRFLRKLWRMFFDEQKGMLWNDEKATPAELKVLHRTIRKIEEDTERFSFNTAVSTFMICVNELSDLRCNKKEVLEKLLVLLAPYAPHVAEELWHQLGYTTSILDAPYPAYDYSFVVESSKEYPVSINGKTRTTINISLDATQSDVEQLVLGNDVVQKWMEGKPHKKIIYVKGKMLNVVV